MNAEPIRPLANGFTRGLWEFRRVNRLGPIAIYERWRHGQRPCYETIIIRVQGPKTMPGGNVLPRRECYPSASQFGKFAWAYRTIEGATGKFEELCGFLRVVRQDRREPRRESLPHRDMKNEPKEALETKANLARAILEKSLCVNEEN